MKLTNLYNYEGTKTFSIKSYARLDNSPIISNAGYAEDCSDELLHPGIYDAAKENRAYLGLAELLGLAGCSRLYLPPKPPGGGGGGTGGNDQKVPPPLPLPYSC